MSKNNTEPFAVKVETPLESEYLQKLAFQHGWGWILGGEREILYAHEAPYCLTFFGTTPEHNGKKFGRCVATTLPALSLHADHAEIVRRLSEWGKVEWPEPVTLCGDTFKAKAVTAGINFLGWNGQRVIGIDVADARPLRDWLNAYIAAAESRGMAK